MELNELIEKVQQWSIDRGLDKADSKKQLLKLYEEFGELASGIAKSQPDVIMDSIGDCVVVLIIFVQQQGTTAESVSTIFNISDVMLTIAKQIGRLSDKLESGDYAKWEIAVFSENILSLLKIVAELQDVVFEDCLEMAWNEIKDRKGKLVDGVWVKEADLPSDDVSPEQTLDDVVEQDMVMNPNHYQGNAGLEALEVVRQFAPCPEYIEGGYWFNTLKYLLRHHKKNGVQDLLKGLRNLVWYISCLFDKGKLADQLEAMAKELRNDKEHQN